eukprot:CAMPEP_0117484686 /NCGR_PEP_ID=MMETSP0784-20121206/14582_1 /TAXON_ID=39447 /ORGANISM="" /LENGTH=45 /DNA_ID= /DNA_START= /DNA_END= /DNA_ORIENTATION=
MKTEGPLARTRPRVSAVSVWRTTNSADAAIERYFDELARSVVNEV